VIGAACARGLAARGCRVIVLEPGPAEGAASPASAGMLAAQLETQTDDPLLGLGVRARDLYATLAADLEDATGIGVGLRRDGIAQLAFREDEETHLKDLFALERQAGLPCAWLEPAEVLERYPVVAPDVRGALLSPEDGVLDPQTLTRALLADARRRGASLTVERAIGIVAANGAVTGVKTGSGVTPCGHVVIAAGCWSAQLEGLPRPLPVEPVRGQLVALPWPADAPRATLYAGHGCYVLSRGDEAIAGTTMEHAGFDVRWTNEGLAQILRAAVRLYPALAKQPVKRMWAGLRPVTPDGRPMVGEDPALKGLFYATGHGRNGILLAGLTGEIVGDLVTKGTTEIDVVALRPERFSTS
jgi:glycine oxidase